MSDKHVDLETVAVAKAVRQGDIVVVVGRVEQVKLQSMAEPAGGVTNGGPCPRLEAVAVGVGSVLVESRWSEGPRGLAGQSFTSFTAVRAKSVFHPTLFV